MLASCAVVLAVTGEPVLAHLDCTAVGLGAFLACGRLGCLGAGCCFGRPAERGVRYGAPHVAAGFPAHLAGARLAPVQLWEAAGVAAIVVAGAALTLSGAQAGSGLVLYLEAYALLRFGLEAWRGDGERPVLLGVSEAQWSSVAQSAAVVATMAAAGAVPGGAAPAAVAAVLAGATALTVARRHDPRRRLLRARHVEAIARALRELEQGGEAVGVARTPDGLVISAGAPAPGVRHLGLSLDGRPLPPGAAEAVGSVAGRLAWPDGRWRSRRGPARSHT